MRERGAPALLVEVDVAGRDPAPVVARATELAEAGADAIVLVAPAVARARRRAAAGGKGGRDATDDNNNNDANDESADAAATLACLLSVSRSLASNPKFQLGQGDVSFSIEASSSSAGNRIPPVLLRDWIVHPIQLADIKAAGGSGALGAAAAVLGKGAPVLTSFAAAMGLDVPLEVVNAAESSAATAGGNGVPIVAVGVSLALSISGAIAGASGAVVGGILSSLPPGCFAVVGCSSVAAVTEAARAGAAAIVVKAEALEEASKGFFLSSSSQGGGGGSGSSGSGSGSVADAMEELRSAASLND